MSQFETKPPLGQAPDRSQDRGGDSQSSRASGAGLGAKAEEMAEAIGDKAQDTAEKARTQASERLSSLADSVRKASDDYRRSEPGMLADLMGHAADGVDALAKGVGGRSTSELLGSARDLGRRNPVGLLLGGVAAGFALSRLAVGVANSSAHGRQEHGTTSSSASSEGSVKGGNRNGA
jgi:hypothetical protein